MRQEAMGWRERGEQDSQDSNSGRLKLICATCWSAVHKAIALTWETFHCFVFIIWFLFVVLSVIQPSLTLEKGSLAVEKVSRNSNPSKKRAKFLPHESELSDSDEYADFTSRTTEFSNTVGDETNSAVQSIQQVCSVRNDLLAFCPLKSTWKQNWA